MTESNQAKGKSVRQIVIITAMLAIGYECICMFRFALGPLNSIFVGAYFMLPFLAIQPVLRLHRWFRTLGLILLIPLLLLSSGGLLIRLINWGLGGALEKTRPLQTLEQGSSFVELGRYSFGGALGVGSIYLEQRRLIVPGLYLVRSIDDFEDAKEAILSVEGPYRVRVHARGNYYSNDFEVDKVYALKPWIYF
jgi:hypothetical protein